MKDNRPINLDISTIHFPLAAITSILHRISGVIIFVGIGVLLWLFDISLATEEGFNNLKGGSNSPLFKIILWGIFSALAYHVVAGIKHLLLDVGIGETMEGGETGAKLTILISLVLIAAIGVWIW